MTLDLEQHRPAAIAARGLRLTRQRRAVVDAVAQASSSVSALQVFDAAETDCPELGLTTVYRTLDLLSEIGALRRVHGPDHCEAFVPAGRGARPHRRLQPLRARHRVHGVRHARRGRRGGAPDGLPHHGALPAAQRRMRRLPRAPPGAAARAREP